MTSFAASGCVAIRICGFDDIENNVNSYQIDVSSNLVYRPV
jgi:hypothetical protein